MLARRYDNWSDALDVYQTTRNLLFSEDLDATVFRYTLAGLYHVAIVAEAPLIGADLEAVHHSMESAKSESIVPEPEVCDHLLGRRRKFKQSGLDYLEIRGQGTEGTGSA